jgi:hypothetical protein
LLTCIDQGSKYSIQNSPINPFLAINNIVEEDEADYACQATNLAGSASSSNLLKGLNWVTIISDSLYIIATYKKKLHTELSLIYLKNIQNQQ